MTKMHRLGFFGTRCSADVMSMT